MKKTFALALIIVLVLSVFAGCEKHEHTLSDIWQAGKNTHWQVCTQCYEKANEEAHTKDKDNYCKHCGRTICDTEQGMYEILSYDEEGNLRFVNGYDAQDAIAYTYYYERLYDASGNLQSVKKYADTPGAL